MFKTKLTLFVPLFLHNRCYCCQHHHLILLVPLLSYDEERYAVDKIRNIECTNSYGNFMPQGIYMRHAFIDLLQVSFTAGCHGWGG